MKKKKANANTAHPFDCARSNLEWFWDKILHRPEECAFSGGKGRCILLQEMSRYTNYSPECKGVCKLFAVKEERKNRSL